jgi:HlyD family type I secretion membrane fusion protein
MDTALSAGSILAPSSRAASSSGEAPSSVRFDPLSIERERARSDGALLLGMIAIVAGAVGYASLVTVPVSARAPGVVVSDARVRSVGSSEGGVVSAVRVGPHDTVVAGQTLFELESGVSDSETERERRAVASIRGELVRLEAERDGTIPDFSALPADVASAAKGAFETRARHRADELAALRSEEEALSASVASFRRSLSSAQAVSERLSEGARIGVIGLNRAAEQSRTTEELRGRLDKANGDLAGIRSRAVALRGGHAETTAEELSDASARLRDAESRVASMEARRSRLVIKAPSDGRLRSLFVHGPGAAVKPGEALAEIVNEGSGLRIEARLPAQDKARVKVGGSVRIALGTGDVAVGSAEGIVAAVGVDAVSDAGRDARSYVPVEVIPSVAAFPGRAGASDYPFSPGVPVTVHLPYGERSLLGFFLGDLLGGVSTILEGR